MVRGNHAIRAIEKPDIVVHTAARIQYLVFLRNCLIRHNCFLSSIFLLVKHQKNYSQYVRMLNFEKLLHTYLFPFRTIRRYSSTMRETIDYQPFQIPVISIILYAQSRLAQSSERVIILGEPNGVRLFDPSNNLFHSLVVISWHQASLCEKWTMQIWRSCNIIIT